MRDLQCEKSLYLYKHYFNLKDAISPQLQAIFNQGNWPKICVDASPSSHFKMQESVVKMQDFIEM
jgi:hypothetical protein